MNQPTKAPERIELPGGCWMKPTLDPMSWWIYRPNGAGWVQLNFFPKEKAAEFAAAMQSAAPSAQVVEELLDVTNELRDILYGTPDCRVQQPSPGSLVARLDAALDAALNAARRPAPVVTMSDEECARNAIKHITDTFKDRHDFLGLSEELYAEKVIAGCIAQARQSAQAEVAALLKLTEPQRKSLEQAAAHHLGVVTVMKNNGMAEASWNRMMWKLAERGLAMPYAHGGYQITDCGRAALAHQEGHG